MPIYEIRRISRSRSRKPDLLKSPDVHKGARGGGWGFAGLRAKPNVLGRMQYQLVLQWPASALRGYDEVLQVEDALIEGLGELALVDGHDSGSGEINIFMLTDEPTKTFALAKPVLERLKVVIGLRAAFRDLSSDDYVVIWPSGLSSFSVA